MGSEFVSMLSVVILAKQIMSAQACKPAEPMVNVQRRLHVRLISIVWALTCVILARVVPPVRQMRTAMGSLSVMFKPDAAKCRPAVMLRRTVHRAMAVNQRRVSNRSALPTPNALSRVSADSAPMVPTPNVVHSNRALMI